MDHEWDVSVAEATRIQNDLRKEICLEPLQRQPRTIAGADISYNRFSNDFFACIVVLALPSLEIVETALAIGVATFPYVPGYLSLREIPTLLTAWEQLQKKPDVVMCDGQGIAHPRRMGIATHFGQIVDVPTFGCAKHILYGSGKDPADTAGNFTYIHDKRLNDEIIGAFVRTKDHVAPVIISPGHLITLQESIDLTLACARGYRIPEPTRRAHNLVNQFRRGEIRA